MGRKKTSQLKVCKFGGTSLADANQISKVCDIVLSDPARKIIVVSAPGKRNKQDIKVTDLLINAAHARIHGAGVKEATAPVCERFRQIARDLAIEESIIEKIVMAIEASIGSDMHHQGKYIDRVKAIGEDSNAKVVAAALQKRGVEANYVSPAEAGLLLTDEYGNAQVLPDSYKNLALLAKRKGIIIFPGFFGVTQNNDIVTFPRGGSDITGAIIAAAVKADVYENFTDVDSVYAVDPRIVADAMPIEELTYREMRELSYAGFGVFHDEAIAPVVKAEIPICIKNTNKPEMPGTRIVPERKFVPGKVVGIACGDGFCTIFVSKYMMNREIGFGRRLLQILEEEGLSYEHTPSGIDNISVILKENVFTEEKEKCVINRIKKELDVTDVSVEKGLSLIMIVGEGMRYTVGLAARATKALAEAGVNIEMLNQGSSEISMMFGVKSVDSLKAVKALYSEFFN